ncbi:melanoma antigen recognized by T-cells 1 [Myotis daubentonii]|uniref:melanoma antigen recognized by T-cells 1 n=1 Tax=Myotis daubentonii TaxID=98922 RepID=UPI0028730E84|nr:melanoma antigen recognized by T-cells 1 [Myotis daubentonii]
MPSEEAQLVYGHPRRGHGHSYITAKEIAGIGVLTVILGLVLFLGCWYCRRRNGYGSLKGKSRYVGTQGTFTGRGLREGLGHQDSKLPFLENNYEPVVPNAPPAYEKLSAQQSPPPYSP